MRQSFTRSHMPSVTGAGASARCDSSGSRASTPRLGNRGCRTASSCTAFARPGVRSTARCWLTWPCATAVPLPGWWRLQRKASDQLIVSPENEVVRRLRNLAHRREPGFALLEGPRVVAEAVEAGVALEVFAVREGEEFGADSPRRVVLARSLFRSISQTVTPQGVLAI